MRPGIANDTDLVGDSQDFKCCARKENEHRYVCFLLIITVSEGLTEQKTGDTHKCVRLFLGCDCFRLVGVN